jgi:hypothetical protein
MLFNKQIQTFSRPTKTNVFLEEKTLPQFHKALKSIENSLQLFQHFFKQSKLPEVEHMLHNMLFFQPNV